MKKCNLTLNQFLSIEFLSHLPSMSLILLPIFHIIGMKNGGGRWSQKKIENLVYKKNISHPQ